VRITSILNIPVKNKIAKPNECNLSMPAIPKYFFPINNQTSASTVFSNPKMKPIFTSGLIFQLSGLRDQLTVSVDNANAIKSTINNNNIISNAPTTNCPVMI
jgi:hypothetical protein